ncbi:MAG: nucleotidyltransferase [Thermoanaerobaculia bacterium]
MDDTPDRGYSRAPELEDLVSICRSLNQEGVAYLLIGGFAVILHGLVRTTKDIDLLVDPSEENIRKVKRALRTLPDKAVDLIADDEVGKYRVIRVADEVVVDLMAEACGITYAEAVGGGIDRRRLNDVEIPFASKEALVRMKDTSRDSDKSDVGFLRRQIEEERDKRGS